MLIQRDPQLFTIFNPKTPIILVFTSSRISETSTHLGPLTMEEENDKIDPRWDELRKLINNN